MHDEMPLIVSAIQFAPQFGETEQNVTRSIELIEQVVAQGAQLVVLPELCNTGYVFHSREELKNLAEPVPDGASTQAWIQCARTHKIVIVAGITEYDAPHYYNSAVIIGPEGFIGVFRKVHLWADEKLFFRAGDQGFPVFYTDFGTLGCHICYDGWFPESYRSAVLQGAEIICVPTNWVPIPGQDPHRQAMANILVMSAAHSNSVFVVAANRCGVERGQPFIGQSLICSYTGWPVAGPATVEGEAILLAKINLTDARRKRRWNDFNHIILDRMPHQYYDDNHR